MNRKQSEEMRPTIVVLPERSGSNAYVLRMRDILSSLGQLQQFQPKSRIRRIFRGEYRPIDILIVSWIDNELVSRRTGRASLSGQGRFLSRVVLFKFLAKKVIFIRHNLYPHGTRPDSARMVRWILDRYEWIFDAVVVHSGAQLTDRGGTRSRHYVPHPLYSRVPAGSERSLPDRLPERYFLVFGRIAPYKKIDVLMSEFPENQTLVVCGEVDDPAYAARLAQILRPNVKFFPGFMTEEIAQAVVRGAQAVVIAHAEPNVVVSGTFFYALSMQRHVFALRTPFLDWLGPRLGQDVLSLAGNVKELCAMLGASTCTPLSQASCRRIEEEFGDEAVSSSFATVFAAVRG